MDGRKSLFEAARDGDLNSLNKFVEAVEQLSHDCDEVGRPASSVGNAGPTPLTMACIHGHLDVVEYLIDECGTDVDLVGSMKWHDMSEEAAAPLWWASSYGHLNVVKCLLNRGANVNCVSASGRSALHEACWNGNLEMVKCLVENGADIEATTINGTTCLFLACHEDHYEIAIYLIQMDVNGSLILGSLIYLAMMFVEMQSKGESVDFEVIMAVFKLAVNKIEAKIKQGGNIGMFEDIGVLHLIGCMARMQPEMSQEQQKSFGEVIKRYVSLKSGEQNGWTPLHVMCYVHAVDAVMPYPYSVMDVATLLLDAGADPQAVDRRLNAPLHVLAKARPIRIDLIRLLLDRGAHFDARNSDGDCFLDLVAPEDRDQLNSFDYTSLQCPAAHSLMKSNTEHQLPPHLANFAKLHHSPKQTTRMNTDTDSNASTSTRRFTWEFEHWYTLISILVISILNLIGIICIFVYL